MSVSTDTPPVRPRRKSAASRSAAKLTAVPDLPAPPKSAADVANKLSRVLGQAPVQAAPPGVPDKPPASVIARAAQASSGGKTVAGENTNQDGTRKGTAAAKAKAAAAKVQAAATKPRVASAPKPPKVKVAGPVTARATFKTVDRYIGTVTVQVEGGEPKVYDCPCPNSHITMGPAITCAGKLLRNHDGGVAGTRTRGRYWGVYQATAEGSEPAVCQCRYGHREQSAAVACAKSAAAQAGLNAG